MGKVVNLETYDAICKERFDDLVKGQDHLKKATGKICEKVFDGFGDAIEKVEQDVSRLEKLIEKLRSFMIWFIVVAGIAAVSTLINIILHFTEQPQEKEAKTMMVVNLSKEYHTQTNNRFVPEAACGPTSGAMGLISRGAKWWYPPIMDPADYITAELNGVDAWTKFREEHRSDFRAGLMPQNRSEMLAWGINRAAGYEADRFTRHGNLTVLVWHLINGRPVLMSGPFTAQGHFVCVVGFSSLQHREEVLSISDVDPGLVDHFLVDDPYGNYHTGYKDQRGHLIQFELELFNKVTNEPGQENKKWLHPIYLRGEADG